MLLIARRGKVYTGVLDDNLGTLRVLTLRGYNLRICGCLFGARAAETLQNHGLSDGILKILLLVSPGKAGSGVLDTLWWTWAPGTNLTGILVGNVQI